jgi:hypothetical protein
MKLEDAFTRDQSNKPARVPLPIPNCEGQWADVVGVDSEAFGAWEDGARERFKELEKCGTDEQRKATEKRHKLAEVASCVVAWSIDDPCTPENVVKLLEKSPRCLRAVRNAMFDDDLFFPKPPRSCSSTQSEASSSPGGQEQATTSAST